MLKQIDSIDGYLGGGRYGDSYNLQKSMTILYQGIEDILKSNIGINIPSLNSITPISFRSVIRRSIDEAFAALVAGNVDLAKSILDSCNTLCEDEGIHHHFIADGLLVLNDFENDPCANSIAKRFTSSMAGEGIAIQVRSPSDDEITKIIEAQHLLNRVLPITSSGTFVLAPIVTLIRGGVSSAYINDNPYCYIVNESRFKDTALLAETLLHEALHQKMVDIRVSCNLLAEGYDDLDSETRGDVFVPWPTISKPRKWSVARALAAHHVYVHLCVFYSQVFHMKKDVMPSGIDQAEILIRLKTSLDRARFLAWSLDAEFLAHYWGTDGIYVQSWLKQALQEVVLRHRRDNLLEGIDQWQSAAQTARSLNANR